MTTTIRPLPRLGLCPVCEGEIRIRKNGSLYVHDCPGDGRTPVALLAPTFARWLYTHRNDDVRADRIAHLADGEFNGCTYSPNRNPVDVTWATAEELHQRKHELQRQWTGSDIRQTYNGQCCDWVCRDIHHAADTYAALLIQEAL